MTAPYDRYPFKTALCTQHTMAAIAAGAKPRVEGVVVADPNCDALSAETIELICAVAVGGGVTMLVSNCRATRDRLKMEISLHLLAASQARGSA